MGIYRLIAVLTLLLTSEANAQSTDVAPPSFDASAAWLSFEKLLHENYGYFNRPGIDGDAILATFAEKAKAACSDKEFIDTLQLISHNFADPHFIVGPFDADDWAIIPTSSDLFGIYDGASFRIDEVRGGGDATTKGVRSGMMLLRIDDQPPRIAIEEITGRAFSELSPAQIGFAFNVALAGHRRRPRKLDVLDGDKQRSSRWPPRPTKRTALPTDSFWKSSAGASLASSGSTIRLVSKS
ncbi:hypothetical protein PX699_10860 [Sphingobium sp. H39-3-25]|jgi:carboxyl-terminal processing protease|nr:hypothetical protein [Sphingobium arseniciresistens]